MTELDTNAIKNDDRVPYEDWSKERLIDTLTHRDSIIKDHDRVVVGYEERIKAAKSIGEKLNEDMKKFNSRTLDDWLKGWIDGEVKKRVEDELDDANLMVDAENVDGLEYMVEGIVEDKIRDIEIESKIVS